MLWRKRCCVEIGRGKDDSVLIRRMDEAGARGVSLMFAGAYLPLPVPRPVLRLFSVQDLVSGRLLARELR